MNVCFFFGGGAGFSSRIADGIAEEPNKSLGTVDVRNLANQLIGSLSHDLQGFIHPRWCRISSINGMSVNGWLVG